MNKISIFSDIHFGKNQDNLQELELNSKVISWYIEKSVERNCNICIFCGDFFNSRNSINVHTINKGYENLKLLSERFEKVYLIVGNHDTYYKHSIEINSINLFENLPNIKIIKKPINIEIDGSNLLLIPWHTKYKDIFNFVNRYKSDYLFGHFELKDFPLYSTSYDIKNYIKDLSIISNNDTIFCIKNLTNLVKVVFTGHYHKNLEYNYSDGSKFISVGSLRQLDWGDYGNQKGFYILDPSSEELEFIKNNESPIYIKYFWSKLKKKEQKFSKSDIEGNYIKLVIDEEYKYETITKIIQELKKYAIRVDLEFLYSLNSLVNFEELDELKIEDIDVKTLLFYINKFIDKMNLKKVENGVKYKEELKEKIKNIYEMAKNNISQSFGE